MNANESICDLKSDQVAKLATWWPRANQNILDRMPASPQRLTAFLFTAPATIFRAKRGNLA